MDIAKALRIELYCSSVARFQTGFSVTHMGKTRIALLGFENGTDISTKFIEDGLAFLF